MKILFIFGTRPEAIKMAPVIKELKKREIEHVVAVTGQHRQMLDQVLKIFDIIPDYDLNIFKDGQTLTDITMNSLKGLEEVIREVNPDIVLIQGDTTTVFAAGLAAFYQKIPVGHIEAGLRSKNLYSPYPEEANRKLTSVITNLHFAPTVQNKENLLAEGFDEKSIYITGNTVIDALSYSVSKDYKFGNELDGLDWDRTFLLTSHRRENLGTPMANIFSAVRRVLIERPEISAVFPVHLNPKVRNLAREYFSDLENMHMTEPMDYQPFSNLMSRVKFVLTDSGGIQEEAPSLGKPVLVIREETERMEGVIANTAKLIGTSEFSVYDNITKILDDEVLYNEMARARNPYGDGRASERIVDILMNWSSEKGCL